MAHTALLLGSGASLGFLTRCCTSACPDCEKRRALAIWDLEHLPYRTSLWPSLQTPLRTATLDR
eukprot:15005253-Alexandrium_andersonii.AAC.1